MVVNSPACAARNGFSRVEGRTTAMVGSKRGEPAGALGKLTPSNSPNFERTNTYHSGWSMNTNMYPEEILQARINGGTQTLRIIDGLVDRLKEKREELEGGSRPAPSAIRET